MDANRPYCISIAGFDPSAGAGLLADIKTFEQLKVYGLGLSTALTFQNDEKFDGALWHSLNHIKQQLLPLIKFPVKAIKIGLSGNSQLLLQLIQTVRKYFPDAFIIWDPILKASAGFLFYNSIDNLDEILSHIDLITPNMPEYEQLKLDGKQNKCTIYLKGGHHANNKGNDLLILPKNTIEIKGEPFNEQSEKHGTGCILSAAIAANIALGETVNTACTKAKRYVEKVILSNNTKLGYHS